MSVRITTLIEDSMGEHLALKNEHGISFFIETESNFILFDTGQSGHFIENASRLNKDLSKTGHIVLSHGHYDHTGGLRHFINHFGNSFQLHLTRDLLYEKYAFDGIAYQFIGNDFDLDYLNHKKIRMNFIVEPIVEILPGIFIATEFERSASFETINKRFYYRKDGRYILDVFNDEVAVAVDTDKGLIVILGCSHPGPVNMLSSIEKRTGKKIYGVLGGTHLVEADEERLQKTIEFLEKIDIKMIGISHCTGQHGMEEIKKRFSKEFFHNTTGTGIEI